MGKISFFQHKLIEFLNNNLWIIPVSIAVLFLPIHGVATSPDSSWYLINALNMHNGLGYVNSDLTPIINRGPIFPGMIAIMFWIFDCTVESAFLIIRLFFVLNILMVFLIGKKFFNKQIGLMASLLVLSSYTMNFWSSFLLLDNIMPFFVLAFVFLIESSFEKNKSWRFISAGVCLGIAFLTKEMAFIFSPLPLLVLLIFPNRQKYVIGVFLFYLSFVGAILSWVVYLYLSTGELYNFLGGGGPKIIQYLSMNSERNIDFLVIIQNYFNSLLKYYRLYIKNEFVLSPLFLISLIIFTFSIIKNKKKSDFILFFIILLFLPVAIFLGVRTPRVGQTLIVYFIIYIILSDFIYKLGLFFFGKLNALSMGRRGNNFIIKRTLFFEIFFLVGLLIAIQIFANNGMGKLLLGKSLKSFSYYNKITFKVSGWHNSSVKKSAQWIKENCSPGINIMCDWQYRLSLLFFLNSEYNIENIPYRVFEDKYTPFRQKGIVSNFKAKPLFVWPQSNKESIKYTVRVLFEEDLISHIRENKIDYIIVTQKRNFLSIYFDKNPGFTKCMDLGKIKIYKIKNPRAIVDFKTMVGSNLGGYLSNLKMEDRPRFESFKFFLANQTTLSKIEIDHIINNNLEKVKTNKIY